MIGAVTITGDTFPDQQGYVIRFTDEEIMVYD